MELSQILVLMQDNWVYGLIGLAVLLGALIHNDKWYSWGYGLGQKLALVSKLSPILHALSQIAGWGAAFASGFASGLEGKPKLGEEKTQSRKVEE